MAQTTKISNWGTPEYIHILELYTRVPTRVIPKQSGFVLGYIRVYIYTLLDYVRGYLPEYDSNNVSYPGTPEFMHTHNKNVPGYLPE